MSRTPSDAMFERIGAHAKVMGELLKRLYRRWRDADRYRPGVHYMRGPGPKFRAKQDLSAQPGFDAQPGSGHYDCDPPRRPR